MNARLKEYYFTKDILHRASERLINMLELIEIDSTCGTGISVSPYYSDMKRSETWLVLMIKIISSISAGNSDFSVSAHNHGKKNL